MKTVLKTQKYIQFSALALVLLFFVAACAKKKKSDDFQNFTGLGYNAVPKTITGGSGLNIAVKGIDINFDGKDDGLYICRTGGIKQDLTPVSAPAFAPTGAGFTDSPTVDFSAMTCSTLPVAHAVVANGRVERVVILNPGAGCSGNQVSITSPVGQSGLGATATLSLDRGKVVRVTMNSKGAGYVAPTVALAGAGGTGAQMGVNIGHDASGILNNSGQITGLYLINLGDGRYNATDAGTTPLVATISGDTGTAAPITVSAANLADSELDPDGKCSVTYDPTNADPSKRYIPQMLFTWPVTPTVGLDVNGDTNADYYLYTEEDGSSRVMTNSDGSGSIAKLIIKNPMINESTNWLYQKLDYGQVIGFDILDNSTIANNVLGRIALDREDATYVDAANPMPIISPIRNGVHYAAPMDVNILCADRVACNAVAYSLSNTGSAAIPNFGNVNLDTTGYDYSGAMHAIRPGDSSTISFRQLPFGNYILNYIVRDAAGRESSVQTITFTIGRAPDVYITSVDRHEISLTAGTQTKIQWTADTANAIKRFRYIVIANSTCLGYPRSNYITPPGSVIAAGGPLTSGTSVTTTIQANSPGMQFDDIGHGRNDITICAITCSGACSGVGDLEVVGEKLELITRDDTPPTITANPDSGMFDNPQQVGLTGSQTIGGVPANGILAPVDICYTWGANGAGDPQKAVTPADPAFITPSDPTSLCAGGNNVVKATGSQTAFNVGCPTRASVEDPNANLLGCNPDPGIYYIKYIARDAAGNVSPVQSKAYAVGVTPKITTTQAPKPHLWSVHNEWGHGVDAPTPAGMALRTSTTWSWEVDFPGTYTVRVNDGSVDCSAGTVIASGPVVMNTTVTTTIQDTDLLVQLNSIKVCFVPQGGGSTVVSSTKSVWRIEPQNVNTTYAKVNFNRGEIPTLALADIFKPTTAIKEIRFICPAGSTGVDTPACTQPVPSGTNLQPQGAGSVEVNTAYTLPTSSRVSTVAYDVRITLCDTSPTCAASAPPVFGTETAAPYAASGGATIKVYFLQDKTAGNSIFVATTGNDTYPGTNRLQPKKTLSAAVAVASGGKAIYVVGGNYCSVGDYATCSPTAGALSLPAGTSIYGGFTSGWYRPDVATNRAVITAGSNASAHSIGVSVGAVNTPVFVEGLDVTARRATADLTGGYNTIGLRAVSGTSTLTLYKNKITAEGDIALSPGPNPGGSYGAVFNNFTAGGTVILDTNTIIAGQGWRGLSGGGGGATGAGGGTGGNGQGGIEGCVACCNDSTWHAPGGAGGTGGAGTSNRGGNGGSGGYQDDGGSGCGARGGCDGEQGLYGGGYSGGAGGARGTNNCNGNGSGGGTGSSGSAGSSGGAAGLNYGQITAGYIAAYQGSNGTNAEDGRGGGGGGGGAGAECNMNDGGGGGSGGGGGGQQGTGGEGGHGGGASVGVFFNSVSNSSLAGNSITRSNGGAAGSGKTGGGGGAAGGPGTPGDGPDDGGNGGWGGWGGSGGNGGHGSGGNGGQTFGMLFFGGGAPTCSTGNTINPASGGALGASSGNAGVAGANNKCFRFTAATTGAGYTPAGCGC